MTVSALPSTEYYLEQITVEQLAEWAASANPPQIVDVRESWEFALASFPLPHQQIPLGCLLEEVDKLDAKYLTVAVCHHGRRSAQACYILKKYGFEKVYNLIGGIDAWSKAIDPTVPRY